MIAPPAETTAVHTRLMKCALEVDEARAYWSHTRGGPVSSREAFDGYWFGARSMERVEVLLVNMRCRFDAIPSALRVLHRWNDMPPDTRRLIAHWHLQFADPLYRLFTGSYLVQRRLEGRGELTRDTVISWVTDHGASRWTLATRTQFASKLLSAAYAAGVVATNRDPRVLTVPRVGDEALEYLLYLLREIRFEGTLLSNPYIASVGLDGPLAEARLRALPSLEFRRQADLIDVAWRYDGLEAWSEATIGAADLARAGRGLG
jgi:hypothetical protein